MTTTEKCRMLLEAALEEISKKKGMTNLGSCCVERSCSPVYDDGEKVAHCAFQYGVARGFGSAAAIADEALAKARKVGE